MLKTQYHLIRCAVGFPSMLTFTFPSNTSKNLEGPVLHENVANSIQSSYSESFASNCL